MQPMQYIDAIFKIIGKLYKLILIIFVFSFIALFFPAEIYQFIHLTKLQNIYIVIGSLVLLIIESVINNRYEIQQYIRDKKRRHNPCDYNLENYVRACAQRVSYQQLYNQDYELVKAFNNAAKELSDSKNYGPLDDRTIKYFRKKKIFDKNNQFTLKSYKYLRRCLDVESSRGCL
jgi:hypothetical protein